jgi:hypothetical protein
MSALLWKEARENATKVATGLAVVLLLLVLRQLEYVNRIFTNDVHAWGGIIGAICAAVLAVDVIAGERRSGTLEFLLVRPTTVVRVLAAKFLVGAAGLLLVTAAFWAMVYVVPPSPIASWMGRADILQLLHDVPWPAMVYAWYLPMLALYAVVFAASAATDNVAETAGATGIVGLLGLLLIGFGHAVVPGFRERVPVPFDLLEFFGSDDQRLLAATDGGAILERTLLTLFIVVVAFATAHALLTRARDFVVRRRALVVTGLVLGTAMVAGPQLRPERWEPVHPRHDIDLPGATELHVDGRRAFVFQRHELVVFDLDGGGRPAEIGRASHDADASLHQLQHVGERICGLAQRGLQGQQQSVLCFDVSTPQSPVAAGELALPPGGQAASTEYPYFGDRRPGRVLHRVGPFLVLADVGDSLSSLTTIRLDGAGPRVAGRLALESYDYEDEWHEDGFVYTRDRMLQRHHLDLAADGQHVYVGWHRGLRVVAVEADGSMRVLADLDTGDRVEVGRPDARHVRRRGTTLFVDRIWPRQLLEVDISTPASPRIVDVHRSGAVTTRDIVDGFYVGRGRGVSLAPVDDPFPFRVPTLALPDRGGRWWTKDVNFVDGRAYALMGDHFAVFDLPAP